MTNLDEVEKDKTEEFRGVKYTVTAQSFDDAISIMVYKNDKCGRVFECQLFPQPGGVLSIELILPGLTPRPLLGSNLEDTAGSLYSSVIASMVMRQSPNDTRKLVIGLGAVGPRAGRAPEPNDREELLFVTKLVESCRVW